MGNKDGFSWPPSRWPLQSHLPLTLPGSFPARLLGSKGAAQPADGHQASLQRNLLWEDPGSHRCLLLHQDVSTPRQWNRVAADGLSWLTVNSSATTSDTHQDLLPCPRSPPSRAIHLPRQNLSS